MPAPRTGFHARQDDRVLLTPPPNGEHEDVEQLGAGSWPECIQAFPEATFELIETHPGKGIRLGSHLDRCPAVPGGWSAWGGVRVVSEVNRELKHAMPVTARRRIEAAESPEARKRVAGDAR